MHSSRDFWNVLYYHIPIYVHHLHLCFHTNIFHPLHYQQFSFDFFVVQLGAMRHTLAGIASRLENQRHRNTVLASDNVAQENRIKEQVEVVQRTKERLEQVTNRTTSAVERAQHLEEMIQVH
jgi:1-aminocyclopropane-1-carboxylate deaminase/D-cysteine desulfhydrase-like pyridoxal-dependent ACC family enzyme